MDPSSQSPIAFRRLASRSLKRCPLCHAVNAQMNEECFVCAWRGGFDHHPVIVEEGLALLLERCPELSEDWIPERTERPSLAARIMARLRRMFGARIDLRV